MLNLFHICLPQIKSRIKLSRHIKIAMFVGTILNFINQYENIVRLEFYNLNISRALITYSVPFLVSVYSAATFNNPEIKK
jgi:hypothetical protein